MNSWVPGWGPEGLRGLNCGAGGAFVVGQECREHLTSRWATYNQAEASGTEGGLRTRHWKLEYPGPGEKERSQVEPSPEFDQLPPRRD